MKIDMPFIHKYEIQLLNEIMSGYPVYYYPIGSNAGIKDGLIVKIIPEEGDIWIGIFSFGNISRNGFSGIFSMPNSNKLCVVSNGVGYIVNVNDPNEWEEIKSVPVRDVRLIQEHNIIVFADYISIIAFNAAGFKWKTKQLAWDNFKILNVTENFITGEYYDMRSESQEIFEVELSSGISKGGVE